MDLIQLLYRIFEAHDLSYRKVADLLGYSSPNSISRLLNGKTSLDLLYEFANKVQNTLPLSTQEKSRLMQAMNSQSNDALCDYFWRILTEPSKMEQDFPEWTVTGLTDGKETTLSALVKEGEEVRLTLLNWTYPGFSRYLAQLAQQYPIEVHAYYRQPDTVTEILAIMESNFGALGLPWFKAKILLPTYNKMVTGLYSAKLISIHRKIRNQNEKLILIPCGDACAYALPISEAFKIDSRLLFISGTKEKQPVCDAAVTENYPEYLNYCYGLEKEHYLIQIKSVFGLEQIPVPVQCEASRRGPFREEPEYNQMESVLMDIQTKRWDNLHNMRQLQYRFYQKEGFIRFAKTGRTNDQFWGLDALTPEERRITLMEILKQMDENRKYNLHLFKNGINLNYNEITEYKGKGLSLLLPPTHYRLGQENTEIFFHSDAFERFLCQPFRTWLEKEKLMNQKDSRKCIVEALKKIPADDDEK